MVDGVTGKSAQFSDIISRLKLAKTATPANTSAEQRLMDLIDIKPEFQAKLQQTRKANAYLQVFNAALRWFNGGKSLAGIEKALVGLEGKPAPKTSFKVDTKI